jgi:uncharacterized protein YbgA (DUF1722 family)
LEGLSSELDTGEKIGVLTHPQKRFDTGARFKKNQHFRDRIHHYRLGLPQNFVSIIKPQNDANKKPNN